MTYTYKKQTNKKTKGKPGLFYVFRHIFVLPLKLKRSKWYNYAVITTFQN